MTENIDPSWQSSVGKALRALSPEYRGYLEQSKEYIPRKERIFSAFATLPKEQVRYILFGQDPYPREQSAIGYAFIDGAVDKIFDERGFSRRVNRATSLRNFLKMALVAGNYLTGENTSQEAIATIDTKGMIDAIDDLRKNFEANGALLLNTALIFTDKKSSSRHIRGWQPFVQALLDELRAQKPELILFGAHAKAIKKKVNIETFSTIEMEHPYNHTFINNPKAHKLFGPMQLLNRFTFCAHNSTKIMQRSMHADK